MGCPWPAEVGLLALLAGEIRPVRRLRGERVYTSLLCEIYRAVGGDTVGLKEGG